MFWGYPNYWMLYNGKSHAKRDDSGVTLFQETPPECVVALAVDGGDQTRTEHHPNSLAARHWDVERTDLCLPRGSNSNGTQLMIFALLFVFLMG